jgi:hypothetical protein
MRRLTAVGVAIGVAGRTAASATERRAAARGGDYDPGREIGGDEIQLTVSARADARVRDHAGGSRHRAE